MMLTVDMLPKQMEYSWYNSKLKVIPAQEDATYRIYRFLFGEQFEVIICDNSGRAAYSCTIEQVLSLVNSHRKKQALEALL